MNRTLIAATLSSPAPGRARRRAGRDPRHADRLQPAGRDADTVVRCALAASPEIRRARDQVEPRRPADERPRTSGYPAIPPYGDHGRSRRRPPPESAVGPELEPSCSPRRSGDCRAARRTRVRRRRRQRTPEARRVGVAEQEVAAGALTAYYEAIAAQEIGSLRQRSWRATARRWRRTRRRARRRRCSPASRPTSRARRRRASASVRFEAERRLCGGRAALAVLLDVEPRRLCCRRAPARRARRAAGRVAGGSGPEASRRGRRRRDGAAGAGAAPGRRPPRARPQPDALGVLERGEINDRIIGVGLSASSAAAHAGRPHARRRDRRDAGADPRGGELAGAGSAARSARGGAGGGGTSARRGAARSVHR